LARQDEAYQERPPGACETAFFKVVQIFSSLWSILRENRGLGSKPILVGSTLEPVYEFPQ
ncbi:MAG TPA: hypothetical protein VIJ61_03000, partial [Thermoanaerobaculia bacterium]